MLNFRLPPLGRAALAAALLWSGAAWADPPAARVWREGLDLRDWRVDCAAGACAIGAVLRAADGSPLVALAAGGDGPSARLELRTTLPLFLPEGLVLALGAAPLRRVAWRTCAADGCAAQAPLDADLLQALQRERLAEITLTLADGQRVRLGVSLLGFTAAWRALGAAPTEAAPEE